MQTQEPQCIAVPLKDGERARRILKQHNEIEPRFSIKKTGEYIVIPVVDPYKSVMLLKNAGIDAVADCMGPVEDRRRRPQWEPKAPYVLIGDIAVINPVRGVDNLDYYKDAAEDMLMNVRKVKAVWLKRRTTGLYRTPELLHLAGEARTETEAREYGLRFRLDIARVYYNPRLSYEHRSVAEAVSNDSTVLDMFSGIGGFTIHIATLRDAKVLAVDINPYAAAYAALNARLNRKRLKGRIAVLAGDAARLHMVHDPVFDVIIMNHPTGARHYGEAACRMAAGRARVFYYTLQLSKLEAADEADRAFNGYCARVDVLGVREVLDYSPDQRIYRVEVDIRV